QDERRGLSSSFLWFFSLKPFEESFEVCAVSQGIEVAVFSQNFCTAVFPKETAPASPGKQIHGTSAVPLSQLRLTFRSQTRIFSNLSGGYGVNRGQAILHVAG